MDHRGQDISEKLKNVNRGNQYERQMQLYIKGRFGITLVKNSYQFGAYDFTVKGDNSWYIEYKSLHIKKVIDGKPFQYEFIIIPCSKIEHYKQIREASGRKTNFIYMISLFYIVDGIHHKEHKYIVLDLDNIAKSANVVTDVLRNGIDKVAHYELKHSKFQPIDTFKDTITSAKPERC